MNIVFPIVLGSLIVIGTVTLYQAYQGLFSSFIMLVLTVLSAAIAWNYCEPLGWSLGKWDQKHLLFVLLFGALIVLGGSAKSIMRTNRYVRLGIGIAAIVLLMVLGSQAKMEAGRATGNSYGQAVALVLVFALSLLCLRAIVDNVVLGNMTFPWQIERVGGGILGFVTGMIFAGVVLIGWQLMPFGPGLLASGYQDFHGLTALAEKQAADKRRGRRGRQMKMKLEVSAPAGESWASYNRYDEQMKLQAAPFPYVDAFTLGLVKALSNGSMGGEQKFGRVHQDLLLEAWANRNGINFLSRQAAPGDAIVWAKWKPSEEKSPEPDRNNKLRGVLSLRLKAEACDNKDNTLRFKGTQVRLVSKSGRSYWPMGIHLDNMLWSKLYGELNGLADERGYLQYNKADYRLWAEDEEEEGVIRREIRGSEADRLWWQVQLLGERGELRLLPASLGVVQKLERTEKAVTIELIFEIAGEDKPDYVVFKRTAMKDVGVIKTVEKGSTQGPTGEEAESADEGPKDKPIPEIE